MSSECEDKTDYTIKRDQGKIDLTLVPPEVITHLAEVFEFGLKKGYKRDSWKKVEIQRYKKALYRHWFDYLKDPKHIDEESGLPTIKHVLCNAAIVSYLEEMSCE